MKYTAMLLVALVATPLLALDQDCRGPLTHLSTLYELRTLVMKTYTSADDVQRFADRRIEQLRGARRPAGQDDPANPAYSTIRMLQRIRQSPDAATIDAEIAAIERTLFPASESLPLLTFLADLRRADELMRSAKADEQEIGTKLLRDTLRRLR